MGKAGSSHYGSFCRQQIPMNAHEAHLRAYAPHMNPLRFTAMSLATGNQTLWKATEEIGGQHREVEDGPFKKDRPSYFARRSV